MWEPRCSINIRNLNWCVRLSITEEKRPCKWPDRKNCDTFWDTDEKHQPGRLLKRWCAQRKSDLLPTDCRSADSKAGISIFCHVAVALNEFAHRLSGATTLLFDVEEHSGAFLGIRRFVESLTKNVEIKAAMIGYPGQDRIIIGSRGFHRAKIRIHGQATHSGSSKSRGVNAIVRALHLVEALQQADLPTEVSLSFPLPPQLTVTQIQGGQGFSVVPDLCALNVDIRLTPVFKASHARELLAETVRRLDFEDTGVRATEIETIEGWPAYVIETSNPIVETLQASARRVLGCTPEIGVAGPSGIGNYLASLGIPATSGFGVVYRNVHAADERIALDSLLPAYQVYLGAIAELLGVFDVAAP